MPARGQLDVIPLQKAIDQYFQLSLYLLVFTGFGTLASTGGLDLPTIILVFLALAVRGYLIVKKRRVVISERWTTPLTLFYFLFFGFDFLFLSRSFLAATVHLSLFAVVVRMFSMRRDRDEVMLAILAFLMVLASAVLTVDSVFLFFFAIFMLVAVATFVLLEMRRSGKYAEIQARHSTDLQEHRHLAFSLGRFAPLLMFLILCGAFAIFFLLPRMSGGYLNAYSVGTDLSTGFSDHVQLGEIGQIQQSNAVVMHIQIDGDTVGRYDLYWRGIALANFDGQSWFNRHQQFAIPKSSDNSFQIPPFGTRTSSASYARDPWQHHIHYRVLMEPIGTDVFFVAPWARSLTGPYDAISVDSGESLYDMDGRHPITSYEADSDIGHPSAEQLRSVSEPFLPQALALYLELPKPELDPRIRTLANQIVGSASNNYDKAAAIEQYLRNHYEYTLQLPQVRVHDPIANFLFNRKRGHCEYFASSMAVMLRMLGIPSRVVNGFRSDEFNDITGNYIVRAKDAHSWVEAYFPGYGWQTFDPTPAGNSESSQPLGRLGLYLDAASSFWRDWIVSYDTAHQLYLGQQAISSTRSSVDQTRAWARLQYDHMIDWAGHMQQRAKHSPWRWVLIAAAAFLFSIALANLRKVIEWIHQRWLKSNPERAPADAAAMWYQRMLRLLARRGLSKQSAQTPSEFLGTISEEPLHTRVAEFTDAYQSARFGASSEYAARLSALYEEVETAVEK